MVLINGRDISEHTHDQVVMFIRASRESHSRELALLIRRKGVCVCVCVCVCVRWRDKTAEPACDLSGHIVLSVSMNIYHSLELSLYSRYWPCGTPAAAAFRPHTHRPIAGRQAAFTWPVGAGHDTGGFSETAGERNTVWHT